MCLSDKEKDTVWDNYMERITNEVNDWDHNVEGGAEEGAVVYVRRDEVQHELNDLKQEKPLDHQRHH